ncbi:hypothetical protein BV95_03526 [Sphingobium chlorophenolicum]|uniref:Uncharacterized protein n=1 Tax=Sphingobium chlorophenolicum TaxID=46429 RepID=A0A081RAG5_SPHCR|nr:hypothetical protein BV95_03526 [Sphingobium chlorophenolicum]
MAQSFLHAGEHGLVVAGFEVDHAIACEACLGNGGRKQVGASDAPKDFALGAGGKACAERRSSCAIDGAVTAAGDFMQRAECEATAGEP